LTYSHAARSHIATRKQHHNTASNLQFNVAKTSETTLQGMGKTATILGSTMLFFGGVALTYSACECLCESYRGEADWKNGALAGLAAGALHSVLLLAACA
jgi:Tim17/Tim22/Tim23/Pmp24 family